MPNKADREGYITLEMRTGLGSIGLCEPGGMLLNSKRNGPFDSV